MSSDNEDLLKLADAVADDLGLDNSDEEEEEKNVVPAGLEELSPLLRERLPPEVKPQPVFVVRALMSLVNAYSTKPATYHFSSLVDRIQAGMITLPVIVKLREGRIEALLDNHTRFANAQQLSDAVHYCSTNAAVILHLKISYFNAFSLVRLLSDAVRSWPNRRLVPVETNSIDHVFWRDVSRCLAVAYTQLSAANAITVHDYSRGAFNDMIDACSYGGGYKETIKNDVVLPQPAGVRRDESLVVAIAVAVSARCRLANPPHHAALASGCGGVPLGISMDSARLVVRAEDPILDDETSFGEILVPRNNPHQLFTLMNVVWDRTGIRYATQDARKAGASSPYEQDNSQKQLLKIHHQFVPYLAPGPLRGLLKLSQRMGVGGLSATQRSPVHVACTCLPSLRTQELLSEVLAGTHYENNESNRYTGMDYFVALHCLHAIGFSEMNTLQNMSRVGGTLLLSGASTGDTFGIYELENYLDGLQYVLLRLQIATAASGDTQQWLVEWVKKMITLCNLSVTGTSSDASPILDEPEPPAAQYMTEPISPPASPMDGTVIAMPR
jgi:hypothetical protein